MSLKSGCPLEISLYSEFCDVLFASISMAVGALSLGLLSHIFKE